MSGQLKPGNLHVYLRRCEVNDSTENGITFFEGEWDTVFADDDNNLVVGIGSRVVALFAAGVWAWWDASYIGEE